MEIEYVKGDLIEMTKEGHFDAVAHGCNSFHTMGSGIAPKMNDLSNGMLLKVDRTTPYGDINKLGDISYCVSRINGKLVGLFNLYTQYTFGGTDDGRVLIHWQSFYDSMVGMVETFNGRTIGIPLIGCGLAGGRVDDFNSIMNQLSCLNYRCPEGKPIVITVVQL